MKTGNGRVDARDSNSGQYHWRAWYWVTVDDISTSYYRDFEFQSNAWKWVGDKLAAEGL